METHKAPAPNSPEARLHFLDYWRIIRIRKTVIMAVFLLVVLTTTVVTFFLPESFSSRVRISVEKDYTDVEGLGNRQTYGAAYDPFWLQTQYEKIKSASVLDEVIRKMNLNELWTPRFSPEAKLKTEETRMILKGLMDVRQSRNTSLIEIWVFSEDKKEAAEIANTVAEVYRESRRNQRKE